MCFVSNFCREEHMGDLTGEEVKVTHKQLNIPDHSISKSRGCFQELGNSSPDKASPHGRSLHSLPPTRPHRHTTRELGRAAKRQGEHTSGR